LLVEFQDYPHCHHHCIINIELNFYVPTYTVIAQQSSILTGAVSGLVCLVSLVPYIRLLQVSWRLQLQRTHILLCIPTITI